MTCVQSENFKENQIELSLSWDRLVTEDTICDRVSFVAFTIEVLCLLWSTVFMTFCLSSSVLQLLTKSWMSLTARSAASLVTARPAINNYNHYNQSMFWFTSNISLHLLISRSTNPVKHIHLLLTPKHILCRETQEIWYQPGPGLYQIHKTIQLCQSECSPRTYQLWLWKHTQAFLQEVPTPWVGSTRKV